MGIKLNEEIAKLDAEHRLAINKINIIYAKERKALIEKHSYYKIGDYVRSIIGIIKIDEIRYTNFGEIYVGLPYWYGLNNTIVRTKSKKQREINLRSITDKFIVVDKVLINRIPKDD